MSSSDAEQKNKYILRGTRRKKLHLVGTKELFKSEDPVEGHHSVVLKARQPWDNSLIARKLLDSCGAHPAGTEETPGTFYHLPGSSTHLASRSSLLPPTLPLPHQGLMQPTELHSYFDENCVTAVIS